MPELCNSRNVHTLVSSMCAVCVCALCSLWLLFRTYLHMLRCHELVVLFDHCDLLGHRLGNNRLLQEADVLMCGQPLVLDPWICGLGMRNKGEFHISIECVFAERHPKHMANSGCICKFTQFCQTFVLVCPPNLLFFFFLLNMISTSFNDSGMV